MASRRLHNRRFSVVNQADSENMDVSDVTCFESDAEVTVTENPALEQAEQNANIIVTSNDNVTICTDSIVDKGSMSATQKGSMSATQLHELLSTLMQTIQSEICKQTAAN
jgi:CCR4-NOT transcriptional regulation complex NOT5 subunit